MYITSVISDMYRNQYVNMHISPITVGTKAVTIGSPSAQPVKESVGQGRGDVMLMDMLLDGK